MKRRNLLIAGAATLLLPSTVQAMVAKPEIDIYRNVNRALARRPRGAAVMLDTGDIKIRVADDNVLIKVKQDHSVHLSNGGTREPFDYMLLRGDQREVFFRGNTCYSIYDSVESVRVVALHEPVPYIYYTVYLNEPAY